jgi:hypothetical protein
LIAQIPHIDRSPDYTAENLRGILVGNDTTIKLNYAPTPDPNAPAAPTPPLTGTATETTPVPAPAQPTPAANPSQGPRIGFMPPTVQSPVSGPVIVTVVVENVSDLAAGAPIKIKFDPAKLRLNDIIPGEFFSREDGQPTVVKDIRNDTGEATLTVTRRAGAPGVTGSGPVARLDFVAVGAGASTVTVTGSVLKNSQQQPITVTLAELPVRVQ